MKSRTIVDDGAFRLALNVLERAGKSDVVQELRRTAIRITDIDQLKTYTTNEDIQLRLRASTTQKFAPVTRLIEIGSVVTYVGSESPDHPLAKSANCTFVLYNEYRVTGIRALNGEFLLALEGVHGLWTASLFKQKAKEHSLDPSPAK